MSVGMSAGARRLAIVDPALADLRGHHVNTALDLTDAARALGFAVVWLTHADLPRELVPPGVTSFGVFGHTTYDPPAGKRRRKLKHLPGNVLRWLRERRSAGRRRRRLRQELRRGLELARLGPADHVLVHTATVPLAEAVECVYGRSGGRALPLLHMRNCYEPDTMPGGGGRHYWRVLARLRGSVAGGRVRLYHETDAGAALDAATSGAEVGVWPNALPGRLLAALDRHAAARSDERLVIGFFGDGRAEKGFYRLPDLVEGLQACADRGRLPAPAWLVHCPRPLDADRRYHESLQRLRRLPGQVTLVDHPLPVDDYYAAVLACDLILLPYEQERYRTRGSMLVLEAFACGKPVVATAGTWLAGQIAQGAGIAAAPAELGEALRRVLGSYATFATAAREHAVLVRRQRDPVTILRRLVAADPVCPEPEPEPLASPQDAAMLTGGRQRR